MYSRARLSSLSALAAEDWSVCEIRGIHRQVDMSVVKPGAPSTR